MYYHNMNISTPYEDLAIMEDVTISELEATLDCERGRNFSLRTRGFDGYLIAYRRAGSVSGDHRHRGMIREKNPETIVLLSGEAEFEWRGGGGPGSMHLKAPCKIAIRPGVWHRLTAKTDVIFLEEGLLNPEEYEKETLKGRPIE